MRDADGYFTYVGRADDVFKASDYRISPFELESALIEHPAVAEAAVVPSPDPLRLAVPKAFVALAQGHAPDRDTALSIFRHLRDAPGAVQAGAAPGIRRAAEDDLRQDPPRRAARRGSGAPRRRRARRRASSGKRISRTALSRGRGRRLPRPLLRPRAGASGAEAFPDRSQREPNRAGQPRLPRARRSSIAAC